MIYQNEKLKKFIFRVINDIIIVKVVLLCKDRRQWFISSYVRFVCTGEFGVKFYYRFGVYEAW